MRQIVVSLLMAAGIFTLVLLLGNLIREALLLLVSKSATLATVGEAIGLLLPFLWTFALPMGMLTATLLVFGRFSADQELTAARASGISLLSLVAPVLLFSLLLCGVSAWMNMDVAPRCVVAYGNLLDSVKVNIAEAQLPEGRFIKDFDGYIFYIGKSRGPHLEDVTVFEIGNWTNITKTIRAARGEFQYDPTNNVLNIQLYEAKSIAMVDGVLRPTTLQEVPLEVPLSKKKSGKPRISNMTFRQLQEELRDIEEKMSLPPETKGLTSDQLKKLRWQIAHQKADVTLPIRVQMHRQVAFSFACFGFTLIGIPLGIRMHRRETNIGFVIAIFLVAIYYSFIFFGKAYDNRPDLAPHLIMWLPNFIFQAIGGVLLWRANRGI